MTRRIPSSLLSVALALALMFAPASAQEERSVDGDLDDMLGDVWAVMAAPFSPAGSDLATTGAVIGGGGLLLLADGPAQDWVRSHPNSVLVRVLAPFRDGGFLEPLGRTTVLLPLAGAAWVLGATFDQTGLRDAGAGCMAANLSTLALRTITTVLVPRARPQEGRGALAFDAPGRGAWGIRSFPSGHAANPAACVAFLVHRFDVGLAEPLLWAIPVAGGLARLPDEAHWLSDTYLGIALGYAVGSTVGDRSLEREADRQPGIPVMLTVTLRF